MVKREDLSFDDYVLLIDKHPVNPQLKDLPVYGRVIGLWCDDLTVLLPKDYGFDQLRMNVSYEGVEGPIPDRRVPIGVLLDTGGHINLPEIGIVQ